MTTIADLQSVMDKEANASFELNGCYTYWKCELRYTGYSKCSRCEIKIFGDGDSLDEAVKEALGKYAKVKKEKHA